jgi:hypothetical protein
MSAVRGAALAAAGALAGTAGLVIAAVLSAPPTTPEEWAYFTVLMPPALGLHLPSEIAENLASELRTRRDAVRPYRRGAVERHARAVSARQAADMLRGHAYAHECGYC